MMSVLVPALIAAIVAILFGSASAAVLSHLLSSSRADKEHRLAKLEEVVISLQQWVIEVDKTIHYYCELADGHLTWVESVKLSDKFLQDSAPLRRRAVALCQIYFEDLAHVLEQTFQSRGDRVTAIAIKYKNHFPAKTYAVVAPFRAELDELRRNFHTAHWQFEEKAFETARSIRRGRLADWVRRALAR